MAFKYLEEYSYLTNVCLNLTDACNFACQYCFVEQNPHYMTYDIALKSVDFILTNLEKKEKLSGKREGCITYFGGEPTIMWDEIIVPLTNHIRSNNLPINLNMTTNASLLNEERILFLKENKISILLSMDGAEDTQTFNRPCRNKDVNSFEVVLKNIPMLLQAFPNTTFRATIYAPTAHKTFENYVFAVMMGFKSVYFLPDSRHKWTGEEKSALKEELDKIYAFNETFFLNNKQPPVSFRLINRSFQNILQHDIRALRGTFGDLTKSHSVMRCGLGTTLGSIGYDGNIYGCQEQTSKNKDSIFYIGNILEGGIDQKLQADLLFKFNAPALTRCENEALCEGCPLRQICFDFCCPSTSYDVYGDFFIDSEIHCSWNRWMFENSLIMMEHLVPENNQAFKKYLDETCRYKDCFKEGEDIV